MLSVQEGDRFLLCIDGFWETVTEADMLRTIAVTDTAQQWLGSMRRIVEVLPSVYFRIMVLLQQIVTKHTVIFYLSFFIDMIRTNSKTYL